jgi:ubiquinone/menaquinone biosynthesis C-methylase UbiE
MVDLTRERTETAGLRNIRLEVRDFMADGIGLPENSADYAMLFNILHAERPFALLREAWRVLSADGTLAIMHWNYDPSTPRGPSMAIRPKPQQCVDWASRLGFVLQRPGIINLPPHHYGIALRKHR